MDLRAALNAISDVVQNRPKALREFDQIYMKAADMLIQAEHVARWLKGREVVFIGDGDALGLSIVHLFRSGELTYGPERIHVLDFDERVINSVLRFASEWGYQDYIAASLYNVAESLPRAHCGAYQAFYTNPPFGAGNDGASVLAFVNRGIQALTSGGVACVVVADDEAFSWCLGILARTQAHLLDLGFVVREVVPHMHQYHLDDSPGLRSCSLVAQQFREGRGVDTGSLSSELRQNFYGRHAPLRVRYVRDLTNGGKLASRDHRMEAFDQRGGQASDES